MKYIIIVKFFSKNKKWGCNQNKLSSGPFVSQARISNGELIKSCLQQLKNKCVEGKRLRLLVVGQKWFLKDIRRDISSQFKMKANDFKFISLALDELKNVIDIP